MAVLSTAPFAMFAFKRVTLFAVLLFTACSSEIPEPTINTEQPSYEFTGTGFLLSGYAGVSCDCLSSVRIDGEVVELTDDGMFQKFIQPHYTSDEGEVVIVASAKSNGFRALESQSEKVVRFSRIPTAFRVITPESYNQEQVTLFFSGTPHAKVSDRSWKTLTTLDENGSGSVVLAFRTDYDHEKETLKFHAHAEGYDTVTKIIGIQNALYDANRVTSEKEANKKKIREERQKQESQRELEAKRRAMQACILDLKNEAEKLALAADEFTEVWVEAVRYIDKGKANPTGIAVMFNDRMRAFEKVRYTLQELPEEQCPPEHLQLFLVALGLEKTARVFGDYFDGFATIGEFTVQMAQYEELAKQTKSVLRSIDSL